MKAGRRLSVVRPFVLSQQTVSVLDGTAPLEYLVQCFKVSYCRKVVVLRVHEELPCILGGYRRVTERGELRVEPSLLDAFGKEPSHHIDVLRTVRQLGYLSLGDALSSTTAVLKSWCMRTIPFVPIRSTYELCVWSLDSCP